MRYGRFVVRWKFDVKLTSAQSIALNQKQNKSNEKIEHENRSSSEGDGAWKSFLEVLPI